MVAPKPTWNAGSATTHAMQAKMGGSLVTPTAPQRTDLAPNRCGEPVNRSRGTLTLQGGEEVSHNVEEAVPMSDKIVVLSPRPATVVRIVENTLPRPRSRKASEVQELVDKVYEYVS